MSTYIPETARNNFKPTFLYIKRHKNTGLLYFGKTTKIDPVSYLGSGLYWKRHIKEHGEDLVETLWFCLFTEIESLVEFSVSFSELQNIRESKDWANLKFENGLEGGSAPGAPKNMPKRAPFIGPPKPRNLGHQKKNKKETSALHSEQRKGTTTFTNFDGDTKRLSVSDPRVLSGEYFSPLRKEKINRTYICIECQTEFLRTEFVTSAQKSSPVCSYSCSNKRNAITRKSTKGINLPFNRKRIYREDGSWFWGRI